MNTDDKKTAVARQAEAEEAKPVLTTGNKAFHLSDEAAIEAIVPGPDGKGAVLLMASGHVIHVDQAVPAVMSILGLE